MSKEIFGKLLNGY